MEATLLVLAGGHSRRMGRPKPWIEVGDTVLLRYVVERLAPAFSELIVSFSEPEQMEQLVPYRVVFDRKSNAGPLAGLEAGQAYLNIHTTRFPGGEIRGFLAST